MIVGAVDIGTNSMRLLIADDGVEITREVEVTGLGFGVDSTGHFDEERVRSTLAVLERYGAVMDRYEVDLRRAVATSATRDAAEGPEFIDRAAAVLGVRPRIITGPEEAALSFAGATAGRSEPALVIDIGGGSTEFVYGENGRVSYATSIDMGSARLTERAVPSRPAPPEEVEAARRAVAEAFAGIELPGRTPPALGVAGTFTSLAAIALELPAYDRYRVDGSVLTLDRIRGMIERLTPMTIEETAAIPSLDPNRAPVLLAGALVAEGSLASLGLDEITVSEHDLLDGLVRA